MSCPDTKPQKAAFQEGSSGAPACPIRSYKSPKHAYQAAKRRGQGDEVTRAAACLDPICAFLYARDVDRTPSDDTRAAACQKSQFAFRYALEIDQAFHEDTLAGVIGSEYLQKYLVHFGLQFDELELRILSKQPFT